ncbi:MAG: cytochrome c [Gammaproteobacteria bacterium]
MKRTLLPMAFSLCLLPAAVPADSHDPIAKRQDIMEQVRDAVKPLSAMNKGEMEFDAATVGQSLETFAMAAENFGGLFPPGSDTGGDTEAKATIWTDRAGFDAKLAEFGEAVKAAQESNPQSLEEFKPVFLSVVKNCKGCHDGYRVEKD